MTPRVFVPPPCTPFITLEPRQSHHLVRVLRLRSGDTLEIFDGSGRVWRARVREADPNACAIERGSLVCEEARPSPQLHLAPALLRSDPMDRLLRQATELGADQIWPLITARTQIARSRANAHHDHWRRIVIGACEQSRRAHLPELHDARTFEEMAGAVEPRQALLLHPQAEPLHRQLRRQPTTVLVGPEGGWTDEEVTRARNRGIGVFSLGSNILRAETAPLAALAAIRHSWGWR